MVVENFIIYYTSKGQVGISGFPTQIPYCFDICNISTSAIFTSTVQPGWKIGSLWPLVSLAASGHERVSFIAKPLLCRHDCLYSCSCYHNLACSYQLINDPLQFHTEAFLEKSSCLYFQVATPAALSSISSPTDWWVNYGTEPLGS